MTALKTLSLVGETGLPGRRGYNIGFPNKEGLGLCLINYIFMNPFFNFIRRLAHGET